MKLVLGCGLMMFKRYLYRCKMLGAACAKAEINGDKAAMFAKMGALDGMIIVLKYQSCGAHLINQLREYFQEGYREYYKKAA